MSEYVESVEPVDEEIDQEWSRATAEPDVRGVEAVHWKDAEDWPWQVTVGAHEFVRNGSLADLMDERIYAALAAVPRVAQVFREDTEMWIVDGDPSGAELVTAVAAVLDELQDDIRAHIAARWDKSSPPR